MDETKSFTGFLSGLRFHDLSDLVIEKAKDLILDQLGVELAVSTKPWSVAVYKYVRSFGGVGESTVVNYGDKIRAEDAVFANSTFGQGFELDDIYIPGITHPGCVVIPAALALGERELIGGKDLLLAVVVGYEAGGRIAKSIAPSSMERGFSPLSTSGSFAAAAAVGKVLGFNDELMLNTFGIAGSHASGLMEFTQTGGTVKRIHAAMAASGGTRAALLAQSGITGPPTILEGKRGFWHAFADNYRPEELTSNLGNEFIVMGTSYKRHCCCYQMHAALDCTLALVKKHGIRPDDIEKIVMGTNKTAVMLVGGNMEPQEVVAAQFSAPFGIAMCVVKGSNGFQDYVEDNLKDPDIKQLAKRVRVELDNEVQAAYPATRAAKVTIELRDGTRYQEKLTEPRGTPQNPMNRSEVEDKFLRLATTMLPEGRAKQIINVVQGLDSVDNVSMLSRMLVH